MNTIVVAMAHTSVMGDMPMPGGWTMSMVWMRMPGQTWLEAAASFTGMWILMMVAMMLPSLIPMLWRYWCSIDGRRDARSVLLTAIVGVAYFVVWTIAGVAVYPVGAALAAVEMRHAAVARGVPMAAGIVILITGAFQFTAWKSRQLGCCREASGGVALGAGVGTAWQHGLRLGVQCGRCCANLMMIQLVMGVMDVYVMAAVMAAITIERLSPAGKGAARALGVVVVGSGLALVARTLLAP